MTLPRVLAGLLVALLAPAAAGAAQRPVMLVVHGGGWYATGPAVTATLEPAANRFAAAGFTSRLVDYAPGADGFADVLAAYDDAARGGAPVCAYGESAGGHWSLLLAAARPDIACVIAAGAPTDLADPAALGLRDLALRTLGPALADLSPMAVAPLIRAPVLLGAGFDDRLVPPGQARRMAAALGGGARVVELPPGPARWLHGSADPEAVAALERTEVDFARASTGADGR